MIASKGERMLEGIYLMKLNPYVALDILILIIFSILTPMNRTDMRRYLSKALHLKKILSVQSKYILIHNLYQNFAGKKLITS